MRLRELGIGQRLNQVLVGEVRSIIAKKCSSDILPLSRFRVHLRIHILCGSPGWSSELELNSTRPFNQGIRLCEVAGRRISTGRASNRIRCESIFLYHYQLTSQHSTNMDIHTDATT